MVALLSPPNSEPPKASKFNHIFIYIHYIVQEIGTKVPSTVRGFKGFHKKRGGWDTFSFIEARGFTVLCLKFLKLSLGRKVNIFKLPRETKISGMCNLFLYIHIALLKNFPKQFELPFYSKYSRCYEVL